MKEKKAHTTHCITYNKNNKANIAAEAKRSCVFCIVNERATTHVQNPLSNHHIRTYKIRAHLSLFSTFDSMYFVVLFYFVLFLYI